ncbi:hypothetical protein [Cohnella endophytica]|uniref:hypothetical protein n=1 Tax=Cohnella endophytica TaxID=2419778 RepID=UPI001F463E58|nr:hypothetical protein [Cohnella endophytica]
MFLEDDGGLTLAGLPSGKKRTKNVKAQTNAFFGRPYGYPYGYPFGFGFAAGFGIGLIASLFLLPFFFI